MWCLGALTLNTLALLLIAGRLVEAPGGDIEGTELEKAASCVFELGPPRSPPS